MPLSWGDVTAVTKRYILPYVTDQFYTSNPLFLYLAKKGVRLAGGRFISFPVLFAELPGGSYRGFDTLDTSWVSQIQEADLDWKQYYAAITIDGLSEIMNGGPDAVVSLLSAYLENGRRTLEDKIGTDLYGTNTNSKALDGLWAACSDNAETSSLGVTTYANISRSSNTWWKASATLDNSNVQITLPTLQTQYGLAVQGQTAPDLIVTTQAGYNEVWNKVQPQQRFGNGEGIGIGFPYIQFNGAKIMVDSHATFSSTSVIGGTYSGVNGFYLLNTEFIELFVHKDRDFFMTGWMQPTNQDARTAHMYWAGNLAVLAPRFQNKIYDCA